jgi:hypothetical protein
VEDASARVRLRLGPGGHGHALLCLAGDAVWILERELAFVAGGRLEIQDASRKAFRHDVAHVVLIPVDSFASDAEKRERLAP